MQSRPLIVSLASAISLLIGGCASSYVTPGRGADLSSLSQRERSALTDAGIDASMQKKPLAQFPAAIAVVRLQAAGYSSDTAQGWGAGRFTIVTTRDVEDPVVFDRLGKLPQVTGVAAMNRLLLPVNCNSDIDIRNAAAQVRADVVLIYTFDTTFHTQDMLAPLSIVTLGLAPDQSTRVVTTASAVLMDTRDGYIYGVAEATESRDGIANGWTSDASVDVSRRATETAAFTKLVGEVEKTWTGVVHQYGGTSAKAS